MYGLIGEKLGHSFSKEIHEQLADYNYHLYPLNRNEFHTFMKHREFRAVNVTIPYKKDVLPYLDNLDEKAKKIGAVNTIVNKNNLLTGYNTDYDGFLYILQHHRIHVKGWNVMVLGNGGAAQAVKAVLKDQQVKELILVKNRKSDETITYAQAYQHHQDIDMIVNTSPVGMYPNNENPIDLQSFKNCRYVIDVIYNPLHTSLIMQAKKLGIPAVGGLEMLVSQAKAAVEHFLGGKIDDQRIHDIYRTLVLQQCNLVLIGMPSSGKTTIGHLLAERLQKTFVDIDDEIVKEAGKSIKDIFAQDGEAAFRDLEEKITKRIAMEHKQVIATGGGCIKRASNIVHLKQNGRIIFLDRSKHLLIAEDSERPLSSSKEQVYQMYDDRFQKYVKAADYIVKNDQMAEHAVKDILQHLDEL